MSPTDNPRGEMPFLDHLEELRWRIVRSFIAIFLVACAAFIFKDFVFDDLLFGPLDVGFPTYSFFCWLSLKLGLGEKLCFGPLDFSLLNFKMAGQFMTHIMVSFVAGIVVAFPYVFFEFWSFLRPGLREKERKMASGIVFYSTALFTTGVLFGYYMLAPLSVRFLGSYRVSDLVPNNIDLSSYISTMTSVTLATGVVFQLPIVVYLFSRIGLVTPGLLKKYRKHAIVGVLILSAIITPPDVSSQVLVSLPILLLYEISIWISRAVEKRMNDSVKQ